MRHVYVALVCCTTSISTHGWAELSSPFPGSSSDGHHPRYPAATRVHCYLFLSVLVSRIVAIQEITGVCWCTCHMQQNPKGVHGMESVYHSTFAQPNMCIYTNDKCVECGQRWLVACDLAFAWKPPGLVYTPTFNPVCSSGMQRGGTRLLDILTTAAKYRSICCSWCGVLGARAPCRAAYCSSASHPFTRSAFHHERIGTAAYHVAASAPFAWQPLADQRRYKSKRKAGGCLGHNL